MRLIVLALYLAWQEQAFSGHKEAAGTANRGNIVELVQFDCNLAEHLGSSTVSIGMSNTKQNDIIESIAHIQDETDDEIRKSPFIAVHTSDVDRAGWSTWPAIRLCCCGGPKGQLEVLDMVIDHFAIMRDNRSSSSNRVSKMHFFSV